MAQGRETKVGDPISHAIVETKSMNAATIRPLLVSTKRVFDKMLEFPCRIGKPTVMRAFDSVPDSYQAIVEVGGTREGYLVLTLPEAVADIAATLLDVSDDDGPAAQCSQAAYLLARMIAAVARRKTAPTGIKLRIVIIICVFL